jgi:hypothetical protein
MIPSAVTKERLKPSGARNAFLMCKSVTAGKTGGDWASAPPKSAKRTAEPIISRWVKSEVRLLGELRKLKYLAHSAPISRVDERKRESWRLVPWGYPMRDVRVVSK